MCAFLYCLAVSTLRVMYSIFDAVTDITSTGEIEFGTVSGIFDYFIVGDLKRIQILLSKFMFLSMYVIIKGT